MSLFRRDVARSLLGALNNEDRFVAAVGAAITAGRLKPRDGEKAIVWFYQQPDRLVSRLEQDTH